MALKDKKFKEASDLSLGKLQALFNKQSQSPLNSDKIKELFGIMFARFFIFKKMTFDFFRRVVFYS